MWSQGSRVSYNEVGSTHQVPDAAGVDKKKESQRQEDKSVCTEGRQSARR